MKTDQKTNTINITNSVVLNFGTPMNRRKPFSWGRASSFVGPVHKVSKPWDEVMARDINWTHMITINPDPKTIDFKNDMSYLKSSFKKFFLRSDILPLYTNLVYVLEYGNYIRSESTDLLCQKEYCGKIHLHGLIRTTRSNGLLEKIYEKYNLRRK